jgi:hypothetical protein
MNVRSAVLRVGGKQEEEKVVITGMEKMDERGEEGSFRSLASVLR